MWRRQSLHDAVCFCVADQLWLAVGRDAIARSTCITEVAPASGRKVVLAAQCSQQTTAPRVAMSGDRLKGLDSWSTRGTDPLAVMQAPRSGAAPLSLFISTSSTSSAVNPSRLGMVPVSWFMRTPKKSQCSQTTETGDGAGTLVISSGECVQLGQSTEARDGAS